MKVLFFVLVSSLFLLLNACDSSGGKYAAYSDKKIRTEYMDCERDQNMSPARGVACNNYDRECLRRKEAGNNICLM